MFTAVVTGGEATGERVGNSSRLRTYFEVTETFKGTAPFEYFSSHADGNSCGISLQVGVEYLVFAPDTGEIGLCSGIVPVSGGSDRSAAAGSRYADALRAFKTGEDKSLAEPWHFFEQDGICLLSGRFPYGDMAWPASIHVKYLARVPDNVVLGADGPPLRPGSSEMTIWVPGRDDLTGYPLTLDAGGRKYTARWQEVQYSAARYFVDGKDVPDVVSDLANATELRMTSAHPTYGDVDATASMVNAGDSIVRMANCVAGHPRPTAE